MTAAPSPFTATTGSARHAAATELAATGPVHRTTLFTGLPVWLVTGYTQVRELLAHPDLRKDGTRNPHSRSTPPAVTASMYTHLLSTNPPDHTRLRRLVSAAFTQRRTDALVPRIQEITDRLLDELDGAGPGPLDLVAGFGYPLPFTVIAELLGVPVGNRAEFRRWSTIVVNGSVHPAETYIAAATEMAAFIQEMIAAKRATPSDDLLSDLIAVRDAGDRLSADELSSMVFLLLAAGHETTVNLICSGTLALLTHPQQRALLAAEPQRWPAAINEFLRFDPPLHAAVPSVAAAPIRVGDVTVPAGEVVLPVLLAANRDPARFPDPDRLDVTRDGAQHLAFGHGIHYCIGAPLARLEGRIALSSLFARFPALRLAGTEEPGRSPAVLMNGVSELPVLLR